MDNKSELSKPVAWRFKNADGGDRVSLERKANIYGRHNFQPCYSQEYVSALLAELESKDKHIADMERVVAAAKCDDELWDAMAHRLKTMEDKLATPVRLKKVDSSNLPFAGDSFNAAVDYCAEAIRAAGFTVEGDDA